MTILIKNGSFPQNGKTGDVLLRDGKIVRVEDKIDADAGRVIDASGLAVLPGLIDMHVHLRDPGQTQKEDISSGTRAAAAGGFTAVAAMPNSSPPVDTPELVHYVASHPASCRVYPIAAVSLGQSGDELCDFPALAAAGAVAFSDDGHPVMSNALMRKALRAAADVHRPLISHCEDFTLYNNGIMNDGALSRRLGFAGHPREAEIVMAARDISMADALKLPVHIAHVSCLETIALVRDAKRRGVPVTCETCPHYFALTEDAVERFGANAKVNPPLRTEADRQAVIEGLRDGTIDIIVTDHAPHTAEEKKMGMTGAPCGLTGLELSFAAAVTYLVKPGHLSMSQLIDKMSAVPARILGTPGGVIKEGAPADITIADLQASWTVDADKLISRGHNTPFDGAQLTGRIKYTICGGTLTWTN